ncbi:tyrosine-type recombinase/integrase [Fundicoccus sp. Sow4_H7]|uniref:tyrosine-type recombinase/integrase n=1 Tax=Fundicoccus sp. Sow4_H7 TaxID=3438784 RepID=UPI003F93B7AE
MIKEYYLKDGTRKFYVSVYLGLDKVGKKKRTTLRGFDTITEAKLAEAQLLKNNPIDKPKSMTYEAVYELWLKDYSLTVRESTYQKTTTIFQLHILPKIGSAIVSEIKPYDIQLLVNEWMDKFVNYKVMVRYMNKVFKKAIQMDLMNFSPIDKIAMPKASKVSQNIKDNFYSKEQLNILLSQFEKDDTKKWLAMFRLLAYSGMRQGELLALTWNDISFNYNTVDINKALTRGINNSLIIQPPKSKTSERVITIDQQTIDILKAWKLEQQRILMITGQRSDNQLVFSTDKDNGFLTTSQLRQNINRVQTAVNLPKITVHGLRHTHCSLLFEAGVKMEVVKDRLGHSDISTTMNVYTHVTKAKKEETAETFLNFMNN